MNTPVVFIVFNRPTETKRVFDVIRDIKPKKLFIISDGARNESDKLLVQQTRLIIDSIDWQCEVYKNYSEKNLGCKKRISSGLDWVFDIVDEAIILEDDCLPDPSFFHYCEELLYKFQDDQQIMHISGNFFQSKNMSFNEKSSYYFSKIPHIWGWATWSRAWKKYDVNISDWPEQKCAKSMQTLLQNNGAYEYWSKVWDQYFKGEIDSWDGQWFYTCVKNKGLSINPTENLVTNIGFSANATHTKKVSKFANIPSGSVKFPLIHPEIISVIKKYDDYIFRENFNIDNKIIHKMLRPIKDRFPNIYWKFRNKFRLIAGL